MTIKFTETLRQTEDASYLSPAWGWELPHLQPRATRHFYHDLLIWRHISIENMFQFIISDFGETWHTCFCKPPGFFLQTLGRVLPCQCWSFLDRRNRTEATSSSSSVKTHWEAWNWGAILYCETASWLQLDFFWKFSFHDMLESYQLLFTTSSSWLSGFVHFGRLRVSMWWHLWWTWQKKKHGMLIPKNRISLAIFFGPGAVYSIMMLVVIDYWWLGMMLPGRMWYRCLNFFITSREISSWLHPQKQK